MFYSEIQSSQKRVERSLVSFLLFSTAENLIYNHGNVVRKKLAKYYTICFVRENHLIIASRVLFVEKSYNSLNHLTIFILLLLCFVLCI